MDIIHAEDVNVALSEGLHKLHTQGIREDSRNGPVIVMPGPVATIYYNPTRRVLFSPMRDANPFFHLFEALWMLAGRNDVAYVAKFAKSIANYSDDGKTFWGAYGYRWREFFGYDQLKTIATELRRNPNSRRAVLSMWNAMPVDESAAWNEPANGDGILPDSAVAANGGKDVPCNTHAYFDCRGDVLNMTVCNRSNDALWGAYGANAVHFSVLLEYMAAWIGIPVGKYTQFSNNLHAYTATVQAPLELADDVDAHNHYVLGGTRLETLPLIDCKMEDWNYDLARFVKRDGLPNDAGWHGRFFMYTARPMYMAHEAFKEKRYDEAMNHANNIVAWDWRTAVITWLQKREAAREKNNAR